MARRIIHFLVILLFLLLFLSLSLLARQNERIREYEETLFQKDQEILLEKRNTDELEKEQGVLRHELLTLHGSQDKSVILTFDDGPSLVTNEVLDILKEKQVKAMFFINGVNVTEKTKPVLIRAANEGHLIGNHSYSHDYQNIYSSVDSFMADFYKNENVIENTIDRRSMYFRFPGGSRNTLTRSLGGSQLMAEIIEKMERYGYVYIDWNVTSNEKDSERLTESLIEQSLWRNRVVILLHDRSNCEEILDSLPPLIDRLRTEGFVFELIDPARQVIQF